MAYIRITPIRTDTHLQQSIDYIKNPDKTEEMLNISSYMCDTRNTAKDFAEIAQYARRGYNIIAYHIIQAYAPEDNITPQKAIELAQELMEKMYPDNQYIVAIHTDKEHLHAHIILNSVDFIEYKKLRSNISTLNRMREISDDLCRKNDLSVIPPDTKVKKKLLAETIDRCIEQTDNFEDFISLMQKSGYEIKMGKYISFRGQGDERFRRGDTIGNAYSEISIRQRLNGIEVRRGKKRIYDDKTIRISNKNRVKYAIDDALKESKNFDEFIFRLLADGMEIKQGKHLAMKTPIARKFVRVEKIGYEYSEEMLRLYFSDRAEYETRKAETNTTKVERLAKNSEYNKYAAVKNINIQIRMFNLMNEYGMKSMEEINAKIAELEKPEQYFNAGIKEIEVQIEKKKSIIASVRNYWRLKPIYEEFKNIPSPADKELFGVDHYRELREYEKATEIMNASKLPDGTLPKADTLNAEIKSALRLIDEYTDKCDPIKKELRNLRLLKENLETLAGEEPEEREQQQISKARNAR